MRILLAVIIVIFLCQSVYCCDGQFSSEAITGSAYCFEEAGNTYGISPQLLWAIAKAESDFKTSAIHHNHNGSYDYGVMQINSGWYKSLGHDLWMSLNEPCTNIKVGAWILAGCIQRHGYTWEAVGCYNAVSPGKRVSYANRVYRILNGAVRKERNI